ncbi:hypothetical protein [Thiomonas intermedia]|uniref:hypothetical protein n=1 Tax=Thiomonas intermedia TaxID=926 RepID=UPI0009A54BDC|nr:hypothetical protein [Thiomonas intermedia]
MKPTPPNHVVLPVLTERLPSADAVIAEDLRVAFEVQPSAYAEAVYRGTDEQAGDIPVAELQANVALDRRWEPLRPALRQQVLALVQAELDALAPQLADRLFEALEPALRASMSLVPKDDELS